MCRLLISRDGRDGGAVRWDRHLCLRGSSRAPSLHTERLRAEIRGSNGSTLPLLSTRTDSTPMLAANVARTTRSAIR